MAFSLSAFRATFSSDFHPCLRALQRPYLGWSSAREDTPVVLKIVRLKRERATSARLDNDHINPLMFNRCYHGPNWLDEANNGSLVLTKYSAFRFCDIKLGLALPRYYVYLSFNIILFPCTNNRIPPPLKHEKKIPPIPRRTISSHS